MSKIFCDFCGQEMYEAGGWKINRTEFRFKLKKKHGGDEIQFKVSADLYTSSQSIHWCEDCIKKGLADV